MFTCKFLERNNFHAREWRVPARNSRVTCTRSASFVQLTRVRYCTSMRVPRSIIQSNIINLLLVENHRDDTLHKVHTLVLISEKDGKSHNDHALCILRRFRGRSPFS